VKLSLMSGILALTMAVAWAQNSDYKQDDKWVAPPNAAAKTNPLAGDAEAVAGGRKLFLRSCAECHGEDGTGVQEGVANLQTPVVQKQSDGTLFWKISNGNVKKGMPAFARLPEAQRWQIVSFLRTLKPSASGGGQPTSPRAP
jgi:mono/diheme cytochrome c family protein